MTGLASSRFPTEVPSTFAQAQVSIRLRPPTISAAAAAVGGPLYSVVSKNCISVALPGAAKEKANASPASPTSAPSTSFGVSGEVFDANAGNTALYVNTLQPLVLSSTEGISSLVIACGTSASGKSHSLFGSHQSPGLIFSALSDLFSHIASYNNPTSASAKHIPSCAADATWTGGLLGAPQKSPTGTNNRPLGTLRGSPSEGPPEGPSGGPSGGPSRKPSGESSGGPSKGSCNCPCEEAGVLGGEFSVRISFVEIRGEDVGDLLRGCEGHYWPGQRIPPVCTRDSERKGDSNGETHSPVKEADVHTLEEAVHLVARAVAFKKARDAVLGSEGTNCLLRLSVERACCLLCPQHSPAAAAAARAAEGRGARARPVDEGRQTEASSPKESVSILKADITFFEAAGVETLLNQPSGSSVNRSLFYLTECLLRLSESPASLDSFAWGASAATTLLRGPLEAPGFLLLLATLCPSRESLAPSLAVLRLASAVSGIRRRIERQFLPPHKSRLFSLHRSVLRESESLFLGVSLLRKQQKQLLRFQRQNEWWLPTTEERLRAVGETRERIRHLQAKILLGGGADWRLLEGSRVGRLCRMLERLQGSSRFMRFALAEEELPFQLQVPSVEPFRAPKSSKAKHAPLNVPPLSLKTKDKPTEFSPIAEVPIHLSLSGTPATAAATAAATNGDPINLTALHFGTDDIEEGPPYAGEGPPYPREGFSCAAVRRLFSNEKREGPSPAVNTPQTNETKRPPSGNEGVPERGSPENPGPEERGPEERAPQEGNSPDPPAAEPSPHLNEGPALLSPNAFASPETATAIAGEAAAAAPAGGFRENGDTEPELNEALGIGTPEEDLPGVMGPQQPTVWHPPPLSISEALVVYPRDVSPLPTPLYSETEDAKEREGEAQHTRLFFKVQLRLKAEPPLFQGPHGRASPARQQQQQLASHSTAEEEKHEKRQNNANCFTPRFNTQKEGNGDDPLEVGSKGRPSTATAPRHTSSSSSASNDKEDSSRAGRKPERSEESRKKLLREASALRNEVMSLIQESPTDKIWGPPQLGISTSPKRGPSPSPPILSNHICSSSPRLSPRDRSAREGSSEGPLNPTGRSPVQQRCAQVARAQDGLPEGPRTMSCGAGGSGCNLYCVHAHVPLSPANAVSPCWGHPAHQGAPQPQQAYLQLVEMPCAVPPGPWGPPGTTSSAVTCKEHPTTCMQMGAPEYPQTAPAVQMQGNSRGRPREPHLTEADRRLPHFRASKGGASWEVPARRAATEAPSARTTAADAREAAEEEEGSSYCLPEEPRRRYRPTDSKSDLLLQSSLRPWTRRGRSPASASVSSTYLRGKTRAQGPLAHQTRTPARELLGDPGPEKGPQRDTRATHPRQPASSLPASRVPPTANTVPKMPAPHAVRTPQFAGLPGQLRAPIFVPSTAGVSGARLRPQNYELQVKGQATLFCGGCDTSNSSGGLPSSLSSAAPTERGERERVDNQAKTVPRSEQPVPETGAAGPAAAAAAAAARERDLSSSVGRGTALHGAATFAPNDPQRSQSGQQHMQQRLPQQQQLQHHQQQQQEHQQQHVQQQLTGSRMQDTRTWSVSAPPSHAPSGEVESLPSLSAAALSLRGGHSEGSPGSLRDPNHPQTGNLPSRGSSGSFGAPHREGTPSRGCPPLQVASPGTAHPAFPPATPHVQVLHSPVPPSSSCEGPLNGPPSSAPFGPSVSWAPASFNGLCGVQPTCSPRAIRWVPGFPGTPLLPYLPARIVNVVKRSREGIATDFALGKEKSRTVYPPEQPLNIPLASVGPAELLQAGGPSSNSGAYCAKVFGGEGTVPSAAAAEAANPYAGPSPVSVCCQPSTVVPEQAQMQPIFFPGGSQEETTPQATLRPQGPSPYYAYPPTLSVLGSQGPAMPYGARAPQLASSGPTPTGHSRGPSRCPRSSSVGPPHAPAHGSSEVRSSSSGAAAAAASFREHPSRGDPVTMVRTASIEEDGDANCFDDCLAVLNARVGRCYRRRPNMPPGQTLAGLPPCPFRRRRSVSRASNRKATAPPTCAAAKPQGEQGGDPHSCELSISCGVGGQ